MNFVLVVGDLLLGVDLYFVVLLDIVEELLQCVEMFWMFKQLVVYFYGYYFWCGFFFGVQYVKVVFQIGIKLFCGVEFLGGGKVYVVGVEGIRYDQVWLLVVVVVGYFVLER